MENIFAEELKNDIGKISGIETPNNKYERYQIFKEDGRRYIEGTGEFAADGPATFIDFDLLFFTLNPIFKSSPPAQKSLAKHLREIISADFILSWCNKFGLPWVEEIPSYKYRDCDAFSISHFKQRIFKLYSCFLLWRAFLSEDEEELDSAMTLLGFEPEDFPKFTSKLAALKEDLPKLLSNEFNTRLKLSYNKEQLPYGIKSWADNKLDVCFLQLALLMTRSRHELKINMKTCENKLCRNLFSGHGNKKYCPACKCGTVWARQKREEGKVK